MLPANMWVQTRNVYCAIPGLEVWRVVICSQWTPISPARAKETVKASNNTVNWQANHVDIFNKKTTTTTTTTTTGFQPRLTATRSNDQPTKLLIWFTAKSAGALVQPLSCHPARSNHSYDLIGFNKEINKKVIIVVDFVSSLTGLTWLFESEKGEKYLENNITGLLKCIRKVPIVEKKLLEQTQIHGLVEGERCIN